jgi:Polyphosphate kinase 2 (PPK2)
VASKVFLNIVGTSHRRIKGLLISRADGPSARPRQTRAYEPAIAATAAPHAPWFIVPADNKWFTRLVVVAAMNEALDQLDLKFSKS